MSRPRSDEKREAIIEATIASVADAGVGASTALIAQQASVSQGTVFKYFPSKEGLLNATFLTLKEELDSAILVGLPQEADAVTQLHHIWVRWLAWGTAKPTRRLAMVRLDASEVITAETRETSKRIAAEAIEIVERVSAAGVFRDQPIEFIGNFFEALAGTTMDSMIAQPARADSYCELAFEALRRALA